ncbi:hypothetical protein FF1_033464 [Malus domestica]
MALSEIFCILGCLAIAFSKKGCLVGRTWKNVGQMWNGDSFLCDAAAESGIMEELDLTLAAVSTIILLERLSSNVNSLFLLMCVCT